MIKLKTLSFQYTFDIRANEIVQYQCCKNTKNIYVCFVPFTVDSTYINFRQVYTNLKTLLKKKS
jgi:hypothetical protein